jgi:hypothetical protein
MLDPQSKMVEIAASSHAHSPARKTSSAGIIPSELLIHTPTAKNTQRNVENAMEDNEYLLQCNELIANDVRNLKDDVQLNEVIANDDNNWKDGVSQQDEVALNKLSSHKGVDDNLSLDNNPVSTPGDTDHFPSQGTQLIPASGEWITSTLRKLK